MLFYAKFIREISDFNYREYSLPLFGFSITWLVYMLLLLSLQFAIWLPQWIWYIGILYISVSLAIRFITNRLLWIRIHQFAGVVILSSLTTWILWNIYTKEQTILQTIITIVMLIFLILGSSMLNYYWTVQQLGSASYGLTGRLNIKTGILSLSQTSVSHREKITEIQNQERFWIRFTPLLAGLGMFLANTLSTNGINWVIAVIMLLLLLLGAWGLGRFYYFILSVIELEDKHGTAIYVEF